MRHNRISLAILILCYAFLYTPILFLIVFSFNSSQYPGIWTGFSFRWYESLFNNKHIFYAVMNSFKVAAIAATFATILGTLASIASIRFKSVKQNRFFPTLILTPLAMPEVVIGFSILFVILGLQSLLNFPEQRGIISIAIGHTTLGLAYVFMIVRARLKDFDRHLEEAAMNLGASPVQAFIKITMPIIMPAILSGWLLAFALSLDDVVIASFLTGPGSSTLPLFVFSMMRLGITPEINALATIIILGISMLMLLYAIFILRKKR